MTQQPFTRRGAIDLSALKRPAPAAPAGAPAAGGGAPAGAGAYTVQVSVESFQAVLEASMTAPVLLVLYSAARSPETAQYAADVAALAESYDGRFLAALVDVDTAPEIAQALQVQQIPQLLVVLDGRPVTQPLPGIIPGAELSALLNELGQQLTAQGVTGRHQPQAGAPATEAGEDDGPVTDPRFVPAEDALMAGDVDGAVAAYQKLVDAHPADHEAAARLAMVKVLQRTQDADLQAARAAAAAAPDDVDAQLLVADLDLVGGHVEDAFARLIGLVQRTADKERDRVRERLLEMFAAVGNDDPRVLKGRQGLASALF
ncbi:co-chaperone YbbN [Nocardioides sp.]|uniref:co-chaperone YbbN n=1 Tax=Nocardioides sp. TaxID=35761 RepID=UPI0035192ECC